MTSSSPGGSPSSGNETPRGYESGRKAPNVPRPDAVRMTRRQFLKRSAGALIGAGLLTGGYAWQAEPKWLDVIRMKAAFPRLPAGFSGRKLVQFSDVHLGFNKERDDVARLTARIMEERPDMICFTGDIVDSYPRDLVTSVALLAQLSAPLGKYAVLGNHDYKDVPYLTYLLDKAGFRVLRNEHVLLQAGEDRIAVAGLEDLLHGQPDPVKALEGVPQELFTLLLMHEPDYADTAAAYPVDLQLSGHSHGGQIRVPWIGAPYTPYGSLKYIAGWYTVGQRGMKLYVNRGFGETYMPFRMFCRPELTVLTLQSGS